MNGSSKLKDRIKAHSPTALWSFLHDIRHSYVRPFLGKISGGLGSSLSGRWALSKLKASRDTQISNYFKNFPVRKLQLGAGSNNLPGWLNSEGFAPSSFTHSFKIAGDYIFLDVCQPFPFSDNSIDYIFHEHVMEHLNYHDGQFMLRECYRILKPGGRIRIATPDLEYFVGLYGEQTSENQKRFLNEYVRFNSDVWSADLKHVRGNHAVFVMNHNFRAWGHQFIYDYRTMASALEAVGLVDTERQLPQESKDSNFRGLEFRKEIVGIFDALIVEAVKPVKPAQNQSVKG
jgi:predicted SAM-dependent methyltransferase